MNIDTDTQWSYWTGIRDFEAKYHDYLQTQIGNPEGERPWGAADVGSLPMHDNGSHGQKKIYSQKRYSQCPVRPSSPPQYA